jgi:hypothetical protein
MLRAALIERPVQPQDEDAFRLGWDAALAAVLSDETYYGALRASPSGYAAVEEAVGFVRE